MADSTGATGGLAGIGSLLRLLATGLYLAMRLSNTSVSRFSEPLREQ